MGGGIIQLVAYGKENIYLNGNPQITFFKQIYRRHTNFAMEDVVQNFLEQPNFGKKYTCKIATEGDLANRMCLRVVLPAINMKNTQCKWNNYIGFSMINYIEIEIGNKIIDKHYGEWMYIWSCLTSRNIMDDGLNKLIGNIPELTQYSFTKPEYTLYIPLYFWFCRDSGLSIPLVSLQLDNININVSFNALDECLTTIPTHYIACYDDLVEFERFEIITQTNSEKQIYGMFYDYDVVYQKLYYTPLSSQNFDSSNNIESLDNEYFIIPQQNVVSFIIYNNAVSSFKNINMVDCIILVDYIYIEVEERKKFLNSKSDYLIEQLIYTPDITIKETHPKIQLTIDHPCKLTVWLMQLDDMLYANDLFNYTSFYENNIKKKQESLITLTTLKLNSQDRLTQRSGDYFEFIQPYQHSSNRLPKGCFMYSYSLFPTNTNPSGSSNMSEIDLVELGIKVNNIISSKNISYFRSYSVVFNVWRVSSGVSSCIFVN